MNQRILSKVLATMLVITLTFANFILLGVYAGRTYASADNLENQQTNTNNSNVEFDAYFKDADGKKVHTIKQNINSENMSMYVSVNIKKGYLKNGVINVMADNNSSNFKILDNNSNLEFVEKIDTENNQIVLKQINAGTQVVLEIPISAAKDEKFDLSNFSKENKVKFNGTYVSDAGKEIVVEKTITTRNEWTSTANALVEQSIQTYLPYQLQENAGTILQTAIQTKLENDTLPIQQTQINVTVPEINGTKPEEVTVIAENTYSTNGNNGTNFDSNNYTYNKDTGILTITVKNEQENNIVSWKKDCKDKYIVTYKFNQKAESLSTTQKADVQITAYNDVVTNVQNSNELKIETSEKIGNIITTNVTANENLSKGNLYTKSDKEVEYTVNNTINIAYAKFIDSILVGDKFETDKFVNQEEKENPTTISNINYTHYKSTKISKENFEKILGTEGYIKILSEDGQQLAIFNKETQEDENGNYIYNYTYETNKVKFETSKPIIEGKLEITNTKALKGKTDYSREQIESFKFLRTSTQATATYFNAEVANEKSYTDINLIAPTTKIETSINTQNLSTIVKNENVEFRVILKTNDISCDLYKNPTVEIVLPNYIKQLDIKNVNLLFDDELTIKNYKTSVNESGNIVINIEIDGENTKYNQDEITKGANIIINSDITLKQLTPTKEEVMKVYVTNENATSYENIEQTRARVAQRGYSETILKAVAPVGMVTTNQITNYNAKNETVTSISGQEQVGKLVAKTDSRTATINMNIINNYNNVVKNVSILGRVPFEGNKDIATNGNLGSNLTTTMQSQISASGLDASNVIVYYSTKEDATKDLTNTSNGWTTGIEDLSKVKSYLIVLNNYEMKTGSTINFTYNINIPENIEHNKSAYATYAVYFDNVKETEITSENVIATKVGLTTGEGPDLQVSIKANVENGVDVTEGQIIKYTVTVKNTGKTVAENVTVKGNIPEGTIYIQYEGDSNTEEGITITKDSNKKEYSEIIEKIETGETKQIEYYVEVKELAIRDQTTEDGDTTTDDEEISGAEVDNNEDHKDETGVVEEIELKAYATATVENYDTIFKSEEIKNMVKQGFLIATLDTNPIPSNIIRTENEQVEYELIIKNVNSVEKNNVIVTDVLPDGLSFVEASDNGIYDESTNTITWKYGKFEGFDTKYIRIVGKVKTLQNNEYEKTITNKVDIKTNEGSISTNAVEIQVKKAALSIKQTTDTKSPVIESDSIIYNVTISNIGAGDASNVVVIDEIPDGLKYVSAQYIYRGQTYDSTVGNTQAYVIIPTLSKGETVEIRLTTEANIFENNETEKEVVNKVKVSATNVQEISANEITHKIVKKGTSSNDPSTDDTEVEGTNKISGIAWLDSNNDGKRDDDESRIPAIEVILINSETGAIVKDPVTGKNKTQTTNENGEYTFANLAQGKYMVIFLYDSGNFGVTAYKKDGINTNKNSDVISMDVNFDGKDRIAAVTDRLEINGSNIDNIDMGLIQNQSFDLKLDKVVTKITLTDATGTKVNEYKDSKTAKLDLQSKRVDSSNIIVEYKIRVTNEGGVAGYAKKIVDYIPQSMKFTSELNPDWYTSDSGNLYNSSLANTLIQPGETKELTLLLTKKMTQDNVGVINNNAEIYESYNDLGLEDIDSKVANKVQSEDDISSADVIIGIKTGEVYVYALITLITITIFGVGIYFINKKVLRRI